MKDPFRVGGPLYYASLITCCLIGLALYQLVHLFLDWMTSK